MYECNPVALIIEQAGGRAIDGKQGILSIKPKNLHQRVPIFVGSEEDINMIEKFIKESEVKVSS